MALVTVRDDAGVSALLSARGPAVPGGLPTTYTAASRRTV